MPKNDRPNILLIMSDQHSPHIFGAYGNGIVRTPNLDALAANGIRFDSMYCPSPLCVPSRMSFLTGRTPTANRVWTNYHMLPSDIPTFAHALGGADYETALIGRMHFMGPDQRHGFEKRPLGSYFATPYLGAPGFGAPLFGKISPGTSGQGRMSVDVSGYGRTTYQAFDDLVTDATIAYLDERANEGGGRPFAAVAGFVLPHCPYFAPKDLFDYYYERIELPRFTDRERETEPEYIRLVREKRHFVDSVPEERIRIALASYYGLIEYMDRNIGRIIDALDRSGLREDTLVIYTSDHGDHGGEHGLWSKGTYYEASVGVPFIASMPGLVNGGIASDIVCNLYDIGPTLIDFAGADPLPDTIGRSFKHALTGGTVPDWSNETYSEHLDGGDVTMPSRMVRRGPWKYAIYHGTAPTLFNLDTDPEELVNLAGDPAFRAIEAELAERVSEGWDPDYILAENTQSQRNVRALTKWGRAVHPRHPDVIDVPDVEDITIL